MCSRRDVSHTGGMFAVSLSTIAALSRSPSHKAVIGSKNGETSCEIFKSTFQTLIQ